MAYGKKYDISWSDLRGKNFTAEIYQDGWGGGVTPVKAEDTVCEISYTPDGNLLSSVKTSQANLRLFSETDFQWQEFFVTEVGEYFLKIIQDGDTIWQGLIVDSVYNEPYVDAPYSINLRFSCGLSELKSIDYLDGSGDFLTGFESLLTIIQRCLNKLPYNLRLKEIINCYDDNMIPAHYCLDFDGTNEHLTIPDADNLSFGDGTTDSPFSGTVWVKMDDATLFRIFDKGSAANNSEYTFFLDGSDKMGLNLYDATTSHRIGKLSTDTFTADQGSWIHLGYTYNGNGIAGIKLYRNGVLLADTDVTLGTYVAMHNTNAGAQIGAVSWASQYADGKIDEMKIVGKELSAAEVLEDYNTGRIPDRTVLSFFGSLVSVWAMGEGAGYGGGVWTIPDEIGSNHASSVNMEEEDRSEDTLIDKNLLLSTLASAYIDNTIFIDTDSVGKMKAINCRYVIDKIMEAMGCRIFQSSSDPEMEVSAENVWWVQWVEELSNETESQLDYWEYNSNGTLYSSGTLDALDKTITNKEAGITFLNSDAELEIIPAIKTIKYKRTLVFKWLTKNNLVFDEHFCCWIKNEDTGLDETTGSYKPRYWLVSDAIKALSNFNAGTGAGLDAAYIQKVFSQWDIFQRGCIGVLRFGNALMAEYNIFDNLFYIEAQFYSVKFDPYGAPAPRSTKERIQINTADSLVCSYDVTFYQKITTDINLWNISLLQHQINVGLTFQIILVNIATSEKYFLSGQINTNDVQTSVAWNIGISETSVNNMLTIFRKCNLTVTTDFTGKITTPTFPFTGNAKLIFRVYAPRKTNIFEDDYTPVKWIDKVDWKECDLQYLTAKNVINTGVCSPPETVQTAKSLEETVNLQDSDIIRDNDYSLKTIIGDGPDESAMGSFRYKVSANNFPITDKWTRLNADPATEKSARNIFLIDVLKNFLSTQKTMISGTLYGLTDFNFQNIIISDKSVRYIMDGMTWNLKTGDKKPTLLELTTEAGSWDESVAPGEVIADVAETPSSIGDVLIAGTTLDSETVAIGTSAGTVEAVIGTDDAIADVDNYPL